MGFIWKRSNYLWGAEDKNISLICYIFHICLVKLQYISCIAIITILFKYNENFLQICFQNMFFSIQIRYKIFTTLTPNNLTLKSQIRTTYIVSLTHIYFTSSYHLYGVFAYNCRVVVHFQTFMLRNKSSYVLCSVCYIQSNSKASITSST